VSVLVAESCITSKSRRSNKWVLNTTNVPLFFLFFQLVIASVLFIIFHVAGIYKVPFDFNLELMRGLAPMIGLNVMSLTFVLSVFKVFQPANLRLIL